VVRPACRGGAGILWSEDGSRLRQAPAGTVAVPSWILVYNKSLTIIVAVHLAISHHYLVTIASDFVIVAYG